MFVDDGTTAKDHLVFELFVDGVDPAAETVFGRADPGSEVWVEVYDGFGTGLGLVLVKQTVERHGGTLELTSAEGEGTTVAVRLPLVRPEADAKTRLRAPRRGAIG